MASSEIFFNSDLDLNIYERFICFICGDFIRNCQQTLCGCRGCKDCLSKYLNDKPKFCCNNFCEKNVELTLENGFWEDKAINKEIDNIFKSFLNLYMQSGVLSIIKDYLCNYMTEIRCKQSGNIFSSNSIGEKLSMIFFCERCLQEMKKSALKITDDNGNDANLLIVNESVDKIGIQVDEN